MDFPREVVLREVGPRDGFQSLKQQLPTKYKLEIIDAIITAGASHIETTAFVSPQTIPQFKDAEDVLAQVPRQGVTHAALVPNLKGAERAVAAGIDELVVVISASEAHSIANVNRSIAASLSDLGAIFNASQGGGVRVIGAVAVAFGCPYQGEVPQSNLFSLVDAFFESEE